VDSRSPGIQKNLLENLYVGKMLRIHSFNIAKDKSLEGKIIDMIRQHFNKTNITEKTLADLEK
jgi:hypothetical protein